MGRASLTRVRRDYIKMKTDNGNGKQHKVIGKPFRKVDARAKCTGQTRFADDIILPRMLFAKMLRSPMPHALIKRIDISKALKLPGVIAVITGKDLPIPYGILPSARTSTRCASTRCASSATPSPRLPRSTKTPRLTR